MAVNHYVYSLPCGTDKNMIIANKNKVYLHRGAAIRALSQYVSKDKTRCSDFTISSILMLLSTEVSCRRK
jgi:hypothetical protein